MRIYLIGFMGVGKSTVGKCLAEELNFEFIDTDELIEKDLGLSIFKIFEKLGEKEFRKLEKTILKKVSKKKNVVISTGGGLPCFNNNMQYINNHGVSVLIKMYWAEYFGKLSKLKKSRPLLNLKNKEDVIRFVRELWLDRFPIYKQANHHIFNNDTPEMVAKRIVRKLS